LLAVQSAWFLRCLYLFTILKCIYWLARFDLFFGEQSLFPHKVHNLSGLREIPFLLYDQTSASWSLISIIAAGLIGAFLLFARTFRFPFALLLWLIVLNIHYKTYGALTAGDYLHNQFLFFAVFMSPFPPPANRWREIRMLLHNLGSLAAIIQVCLAYCLAGLAKAADPVWQTGDALALTLTVEHYRTFHSPDFLKGILPVLNFLVIVYQLTFPVLIWLRGVKKWILALGIVMNLYVMFGMGLVSFGAIMLISYLLFIRSSGQITANG
jgi:hypothetical protein